MPQSKQVELEIHIHQTYDFITSLMCIILQQINMTFFKYVRRQYIGWLGPNTYYISLKGKYQTILNHDMRTIIPEVSYAEAKKQHMFTLTRILISFDMLRNISHH